MGEERERAITSLLSEGALISGDTKCILLSRSGVLLLVKVVYISIRPYLEDWV